MKRNIARLVRFALFSGWTLSFVLLLVSWTTGTRGQGSVATHLPTDWSHRHLVFSPPNSMAQAWKLQGEPRYWHQWLRQHASVKPATDTNQGALEPEEDHEREDDRDPFGHHQRRDQPHRDWSMSLLAGGTTGQEMFPAKFTFNVNAAPDCTNDFVAFNTSVTPAAGPSLIAFNELYSTQGMAGGFCIHNGPSVLWSYNTNPSGDTTGANVTSPVLSLDGKKLAYVETRTNANGGAILHILQWKAGEGTLLAPVPPDQIVASWGSCTSGNSCIVNETFGNAQPDSNSAPFYNYSTDTLYVGDDNGVLHKFNPVFAGTPAEATTGGWPITVHAATVLSSPVFDSGSGNIFLGDAAGRLSYVREVGSTVGACGSGSPPCLGSTNVTLTGADIVDAPIVDSSAGRVFIFGNDTTNGGTVEQVNTALGSPVSVNVGGTTTPGSVIHSGAFDSAYLSGSFTTGHLFVCGKNITNRDRPAIHRIGFGATGVMNATSDGHLSLVSGSGEQCSPVTEILNGATDQIFFSVANRGNQTGCGGTGCIMSLTLGGSWPPGAVTHGVPASGGTSGIIVDNVSNDLQASSIYFTFLSNSTAGITCNGSQNVGCAVKLTQAALQ